jgi:hypothetical protein
MAATTILWAIWLTSLVIVAYEVKTAEKTIGTMTASELERYIQDLEEKHRARIRTLKALMRARKAEEEAKE